jgi:hypothetical protein
MSVPKKQRFLKLMRMEKVLPSDIYYENISDSSPNELLSLLSFAEFLRLKEEVKANHVGSKRPHCQI